MSPDTVAIFSGGMDSATLLTELHRMKGPSGVVALGFNYGQRHRRELEYALRFAGNLEVPYTIVDLSSLGPLLRKGSQMDDRIPVPFGHYADETMQATVVPNRNMIMLSIAVGHAITIGAKAVAYAAHAGDHAIYPDCRPTFVQAMREAINACDYKPPALSAPYLGLTKADICARGVTRLGIDYSLTWSCYVGGTNHCGRCGTCVERREAFELAQLPDPTVYDHQREEART